MVVYSFLGVLGCFGVFSGCFVGLWVFLGVLVFCVFCVVLVFLGNFGSF